MRTGAPSDISVRSASDLPINDARLSTLCIQVARLGNEDAKSTLPSSSLGAGTPAASANATANANPSPDAEGYEDWIKARAAAVGVSVALEKERQARCVLA